MSTDFALKKRRILISHNLMLQGFQSVMNAALINTLEPFFAVSCVSAPFTVPNAKSTGDFRGKRLMNKVAFAAGIFFFSCVHVFCGKGLKFFHRKKKCTCLHTRPCPLFLFFVVHIFIEKKVFWSCMFGCSISCVYVPSDKESKFCFVCETRLMLSSNSL